MPITTKDVLQLSILFCMFISFFRFRIHAVDDYGIGRLYRIYRIFEILAIILYVILILKF